MNTTAFEYEYYLHLSRPDGETMRGRILSTINLRGLIAEGKWVVEDGNVLTNPTIDKIMVLKEPATYPKP